MLFRSGARGERAHFALVEAAVEAIDWLELHAQGHRRAAFDAAPLDDFPLTAAAVPTMATWVSKKQFRWALGRLLDGVVGS